MITTLTSERLILKKLALSDAAFVFKLLNTPDWKTNIGDRQIQTINDAEKYIEKVSENSHLTYWTIHLKTDNQAIGIITLIERDFLDHKDIGFALLPEFYNFGYAYEASKLVLHHLKTTKTAEKIYAIVIETNQKSKALLLKLGLTFQKNITVDDEKLMLYAIDCTQKINKKQGFNILYVNFLLKFFFRKY